ncbi:hypothetical protein [Ehrlichia ruminantium]|nr:hypothetical protein [Ehrlichia ruminantium]
MLLTKYSPKICSNINNHIEHNHKIKKEQYVLDNTEIHTLKT